MLKPKIEPNLIAKEYEKLGNVTHVANSLGIATCTAWKHLQRLGVDTSKTPLRGENHWHWKGGITSEAEKLRKSDEYKTWRRMVFSRDGFVCQMPGCENKHNIHAHHIVPIYEDGSLAKDVSNGITLCRECHEKTYGHESDFAEMFLTIVKDKPYDINKFIDYISDKIPEESRPCECGCGQMTKVVRGKARRFIHGHHTRGRKMSDETKEKCMKAEIFFKSVDVDCNVVKSMYESGMSCNMIANELGLSSTLIVNKVKELGISRSLSEAQKLRFNR